MLEGCDGDVFFPSMPVALHRRFAAVLVHCNPQQLDPGGFQQPAGSDYPGCCLSSNASGRNVELLEGSLSLWLRTRASQRTPCMPAIIHPVALMLESLGCAALVGCWPGQFVSLRLVLLMTLWNQTHLRCSLQAGVVERVCNPIMTKPAPFFAPKKETPAPAPETPAADADAAPMDADAAPAAEAEAPAADAAAAPTADEAMAQ